MKKILSFVLAAMLLVTFAGRDALGALQSLLDSTEPSTGVRTTITEEEFLAAMEINNFSANATNPNLSNSGSAKTNGSIMYQYEYRNNEDGTSELEFYFATINNIQYQIRKEASGYVAYEYAGTFKTYKLGDLFGFSSYRSYTYNKETKSYTYESNGYVMTLCFENGTIKTATYTDPSSMTYSFFDIGTTIVELPEFTYATTNNQ